MQTVNNQVLYAYVANVASSGKQVSPMGAATTTQGCSVGLILQPIGFVMMGILCTSVAHGCVSGV